MSELIRAMIPRIAREMLQDALRGLIGGEVVHRVPLASAWLCGEPKCGTIHGEKACPGCGTEEGAFVQVLLEPKRPPEPDPTAPAPAPAPIRTEPRLTYANGRKRRTIVTDEQKSEMVKRYKAGESQIGLGAIFNVSPSAISNWVKEGR